MVSDAALYALTNAIQPVRRAWVQAVTRQIEGAGVSSSLATVVLVASRFGSTAHQKALAEEIGVNPAALVRLLDQGEASGLLVRIDGAGDRRTKVVKLLPEGKRLAREMEQSVAALRQELLGDLSADDVETATRVLHLLKERAGTWLRSTED